MKDVIIVNKNGLEEKEYAILEDGINKLHVITDFDRTLTKAFVDGQKTPTVLAQIRDGNYLTPDYSSRAHALFDKYHPIEIDPNLNREEKIPKMHEWWKKHLELLIECGLDKKVMKEIVSKKTLKFREGALDFLDYLHKYKIPLIIMSATLGDMIAEYLRQEKRLYSNIHIIANQYEFDEEGKVVKIKEPIIHSMNKHEVSIDNYPVFNLIKNKRNVLLLGDGLEDIGMIEGFEYKNLIKIGFLNENVNENIERFKEDFDVVLLNDISMDYVNKLLKQIIS